MDDIEALLKQSSAGDFKSLARIISLVENDSAESDSILRQLKINYNIPVIGFTGPPGAGKSSIVNSLLKKFSAEGKRVAVLAVDPTSPFNFGSLLGDRIRWSDHYSNKNIFMRSMATRGALGGLSEKIIEVTDVLRSAPFDFIFIETVGVGQSEVEIAGLADVTIVVLVPESGDEIQTMKAGLMEIADIFVVNKCDRDGADMFAKNVFELTHEKNNTEQIPVTVIKTSTTNGSGIDELITEIKSQAANPRQKKNKLFLLKEKALKLLVNEKIKLIDQQKLLSDLSTESSKQDFNLYEFVKKI